MSGLGVLLRQRLRRDRTQVPLWIIGTALMAYAGYTGVSQSYATVLDRQEILAAVAANPVILLFRGLPSGTSPGGFLAFEVLPWLAMLAGLMSTFLAVRHTRGDEEAGRSELLSATPAGRTTPTVATILHGVAANIVLAVLVALALLGCGLDAGGSMLTGAASGMAGIAFLGVGLLAAQLMRTSRAANSLAIWVLVAAFLIRGIGNAAGTTRDDLTHLDSSWLAWLSPFGWAEQTRPFDADSWWPVLLGVAIGLGLAAASAALQSARDMGASFVAQRPGRADARPALRSPHALVWRLTTGSIIGWAVAGAITGLLATTLTGLVDQVAGQNPAIVDILEKISGGVAVDQSVIVVFFTMLGIFAACAAVQIVARARQEEAHGTAEPVRAAPVGRVHWLSDYLIVGAIAVAVTVLAAVATGYLGLAANGAAAELYRVLAVSALGQLLAALVFVVLTALIFVIAPHATIGLAWALLLVATMLGMFGPLFGLPDWTTDLSPFSVTPLVHGADIDARGTWWLVLAIAVGAAASLTLMRRRELAGDG